MPDTAYERLVDALREKGSTVSDNGHGKGQAQCPAHEDGRASLSLTRIDGSVLMYCHAGCETADVLAALGLAMRDLYDDRKGATYNYPDGRRVHRTPDKRFWQKGDTKGRNGRSLFRADRIGDAATVFVTEGEKDVLAVEALGGVAVCPAMGAGKASQFDWEPLRGRYVVVVVDDDKPGYAHADQVAGLLRGVAAAVVGVKAAEGKDAADHIAAGHSLDEFALVTAEVSAEAQEIAEASHAERWGLDPSAFELAPAEAIGELQRLIAEGKPITSPNTTATPQHRRSDEVPPLAQLRRILDAVGEEVRKRGLVGEERLAKVLYLVLTSRLLDKQVSAGVKGHSASGKSYTVETVTRFFPPESYIEFTAMSERALIYSDEQYSHRTIVIYEVTALREGVEDDMTSYFVRSLLSEGRIDYEVTVRDKNGGFTTNKITKKGPTNLVFTTTKTRVHAENETRILSLSTDDSSEQTARVLLELADESAGTDDLEKWRDLQSWLAGAEHRVTVPYGRRLAESVPPVAVRLRRDFGALLALIRAHAVLHQANRDNDDTGRIIATIEDYTVVRELVADVMAEGVGKSVSDTIRETVEAVVAIGVADGVSVRAVAEKLALDKSNAGR